MLTEVLNIPQTSTITNVGRGIFIFFIIPLTTMPFGFVLYTFAGCIPWMNQITSKAPKKYRPLFRKVVYCFGFLIIFTIACCIFGTIYKFLLNTEHFLSILNTE